MFRRLIIIFGIVLPLIFASACSNKKVSNPLANVGSKQPDKVLFDRAMDALKHNKYDVARITLQTLINTYPDSEYIARAKLAVGDSWYAEGGTAAITQAEAEYKDFITFFPNMPEAAEAQLKIANIHYQQMEKPDRDFTHAVHAEEEYRNLIEQYPDSKLVPQAKQRLREVQEVLAEREFRIGHFYYLRQSWPAAIARLRSLTDTYPLYSGADEALYLLGQCYEGEIALIRQGKMSEVYKGKMIKQFTNDAAAAYSKIITRYPVMNRAEDAEKRLEALHRPVPKPTKQAIAQNQAEEASRQASGMIGRVWGNLSKHPDTSEAAHVGDPPLIDPKPSSATEVVQEAQNALLGKPTSVADSNKVSVETVGTGQPAANEPVPHSGDATPTSTSGSGNAAAPASGGTPATGDSGSTDSNSGGIGELAPNVSSGPPASGNAPDNSAAPAAPPGQVNDAAPTAAPAQVNDAAAPGDGTAATNSSNASQTSAQGTTDQANSNDQNVSSSRHTKKKKKGLGKLSPF